MKAAARLAQRLEIPMNMETFDREPEQGGLLLALAQGAEVLILDQPTAGLDAAMGDEIVRTLIEDHERRFRWPRNICSSALRIGLHSGSCVL